MKMKINILVFALIFSAISIRAQDFHLSQYDATPHYFNPGLTGVYFGDDANYRIYSDYRTQWRSLGVKPFATYYLAYDRPFKKQWGLGGYLIHNRNGRGGLNTINFMPSGTYKIIRDKESPHNVSVGAQLGILYKSFDPNSFTYDAQFSVDDPDGFDQTIPSGEVWSKTSMLKLDANMGVFYKNTNSEWKVHPWGGFAYYHITKPNQSLTGTTKDKLPMRFVAEIGADYKINEELSATPMIMYMTQGKATELNIGAMGFYHIKDSKYDVLLGLNLRTKDAFIIQAGMKYEKHVVTFSYDINTSYLNNYTNGKGAFEVSLLLSGITGQPLFNAKFKRGSSINKAL